MSKTVDVPLGIVAFLFKITVKKNLIKMFKISFFCFEKEVKVAVKKLLNLNVGCE